jgi:hypothetical protein
MEKLIGSKEMGNHIMKKIQGIKKGNVRNYQKRLG